MQTQFNTIKTGEKLAYGLGSFGKDFIMAMLSTYLLFFYTDVFGISAASAGSIILSARIWDAINDPILGAIADRTRTRWGKFRPYILIIPIPLAAFAVLTFTVPSLSVSGKLIWAAVTYIGTGMLFTAYDVPLWAMVPSLAKDEVSRNQLIALARTFTIVAFLIVNVMALPMVSLLGGENASLGYQRLLLFIGMISVVFAWITFFFTKEQITPPKESPTVKDYVSIIKSNPIIFILLLVIVIPSFQMSISGAVGVYALTYWIGNADLIPFYMLAILTGSILGMASTPAIVKRIGSRKAVTGAMLFMPFPMTGLFFFAPMSSIALILLAFAGSTAIGVPAVAIPALLANTADTSAKQSSIRADGVIFSLNSFSIKVGLALGGGITGYILGLSGYIPNSTEQPPSAMLAISLLWTIVPGLVSLLGAMLYIRYGKIKKT